MGLKKKFKGTDGMKLREYIDSFPRAEYRKERKRLADALHVKESRILRWTSPSEGRSRFSETERAVLAEAIGRDIF